jgi:hypothetical protein
MTSTDMSTMATFSKHMDDIRKLSLCQICIKPFYEPFILSCGHTYCYTCLTNWIGGDGPRRKKKKSCPDCRAKITTQPSPNYVLRDLVHMLINRAELLPEDESLIEHIEGKEAEAKALSDDRNGPGLFKGVFAKSSLLDRHDWRLGILDASDGVRRCPACNWELEDGLCNQCGYNPLETDDEDFSDMSDISIELQDGDSEIDDDDHDDDFDATMAPIYDRINISDEDDEDDSEMDDFLDDGVVQGDSDADTESTMTLYNRQFDARPDSDDDQASVSTTPGNVQQYAAAPPGGPSNFNTPPPPYMDNSDAGTNYDETSDAETERNLAAPPIIYNHAFEFSDEDSKSDVTAAPPSRTRRRPTRVVDSEDDEEDSETPGPTNDYPNTITVNSSPQPRGRRGNRVVLETSDESSEEDDESIIRPSSSSRNAPPASRRSRVTLEDSEEESEEISEAEQSGPATPSEQDAEQEDSDDDIRPSHRSRPSIQSSWSTGGTSGSHNSRARPRASHPGRTEARRLTHGSDRMDSSSRRAHPYRRPNVGSRGAAAAAAAVW